MRTVVSSGRSHSWALVNIGALPAYSFKNLWSTSTGLLLFWYEKCCYFLTVPSKLKLRIFPAASLRRKSLSQITICLWTLNSGPLKIKKMVPMFNSKRKLLSLKWYPDYNWPWGTCSTWNIGHSLQGQQGVAPLRSNNQSGHRNCLFRQIKFNLMLLMWKIFRFITWVNLMFYVLAF